MNLSGVWTRYSYDNSPFPQADYHTFISGLTSGLNGKIWATIQAQEKVAIPKIWMEGILLFDQDKWTWFPWVETGLPQVIFNRHIACDTNGDLWLATVKLIGRFGGNSSRLFNAGEYELPQPPLFPGWLVSGSDSELWTILRSTAYHFYEDIWHKLTIDDDRFRNGAVFSIDVSVDGRVWLALERKNETYFVQYDGTHWEEYAHIHSNMDDDITTFIVDPDGKLWIGWSQSGLWVFDRKSNKWSKYTIRNSALPSNSIKTLVMDKSKRIWVGASDGIAVFDETESVCWWKIKPDVLDSPLSKKEVKKFRRRDEGPQANISFPTVYDQVVIDTQGRIWASSGNGISVFQEHISE